jgi:hypothetical protein
MKQFSFIIALVFVFSIAQAQESKVFFGGAYAGLSASQLSGDQLSGFKKAGIYAGAFVNFHVTEKSAIQLELSFIQKGSRSVSKTSGLAYASRLNYFEMPLLYTWQFHKRFGLQAGPATGFLIKTTDVERDAYGVLQPSRPAFNRIDLSAMGGFTINIIEHLRCDIRFSQSVLPIRKHASGAVYRLNRGQYNSVIGLTIVLEY